MSKLPPRPFVAFSYPSDDRVAARRLEKDLQVLGINVWTYEKLEAGDEIRREIEKAIQAADALILLFFSTGQSRMNDELLEELQVARASQRPVLSLLESGQTLADLVPPSLLPEYSVNIDGSDYEEILGSTIQTLEALGFPVENSPIRIRIMQDPLTAQNLMTIISALTELHTKCWLIQENRFADLMDYAQTRDIRFNKEANLRIAQMTHNSPALIDFVVSSASIAGTATLALALKTAIDAVVQAPLRFRSTQLQNQKEVLEQKIHEQEAQKALQTTDQKVQIELERKTMLLELTKKQIEVDKQQLELDKQRLEMEKDRVKVVLEITKTMVGQLRSDTNEETREMLIHSLVPSLLQLATAEGLELALPVPQKNQKQEFQTENK